MNQNYTSYKKAIYAMTAVAAAWQTDLFVCAPMHDLRLMGLKGGVL